ncbi:MAG TPA: kelch repeat-containing protein [Opitutaceae bacterium]|nr:kelch repeat-containing protein [Opitutaceae bacterium]HND61190.1 kelch repeat-containing protein [Opitutaceae bacterium]
MRPFRCVCLLAGLALSLCAEEPPRRLDPVVVHAPPLPAKPVPPLIRLNLDHHLGTARFAAAAVADGDFIYIVGGANSEGTRLRSIERYDVRNGKCELFAELKRGRRNHRVVVVDHRLYVIGGYAETTWVGDEPFEPMVEIVDLATGRVTRGPDMPEPRANFACVAAGGDVYVIGGARRRGSAITNTNTTWVLNLARQHWSSGVPMITPRMAGAALVDGGFIVVPGGFGGNMAVANVEVYIPSEHLWRVLPPLHARTPAMAVTFLGHYLFLFGEHELVAYDLVTKRSTPYSFEYEAGRDVASVIAGGRVYVFGGDHSREPLDMEYYFPTPNADSLPTPGAPRSQSIATRESGPSDADHEAMDTIQVFELRDVAPVKP